MASVTSTSGTPPDSPTTRSSTPPDSPTTRSSTPPDSPTTRSSTPPDSPTARSSMPATDEPRPEMSIVSMPNPLPRLSLFSRPAVDVKVLSADGTEFHILLQYLVDASSVLESMCYTSAPPICIDLPETSDMAEVLLQFCHPLAPKQRFRSFDAAQPIFCLCWRYALRGNAYRRALSAVWPCISSEPIRVYVYAAQNDQHKLMATAARASRRIPGTLSDQEELDTVSGAAYRRLLAYRQACSDAVARLATYGRRNAEEWVWVSCGCAAAPLHGRANGYAGGDRRAPWFNSFFERVMQRLQARPDADTIGAVEGRSLIEQAVQDAEQGCDDFLRACERRSWEDLPLFLGELAEEVRRIVAEVPF